MIKIKPDEMAKMMDASGYQAVLIRPIRQHIKKEGFTIQTFCDKFDYDATNFSKRKGERIYIEFEGRRVIAKIERELGE